jgi:hypothetical protein
VITDRGKVKELRAAGKSLPTIARGMNLSITTVRAPFRSRTDGKFHKFLDCRTKTNVKDSTQTLMTTHFSRLLAR